MAIEQLYHRQETAKNYTKVYDLDKIDSIMTRQEDGMLGYISAGEFATTGSNIFTNGQIIIGNLTIDGDIFANTFNVTTTSIEHFTASTRFGLDADDTHTFTGSVYITGSEYLKGDLIISGNVYISGTTEFGGNLVPKTARGATLGTSERPFSEIYVSSGSINIASDIIGAPNTALTNVDGNILVSAGGMRLVGNASFIAATGSFQYLSGSFTHIGSQFNEGDIVTTGSLSVSGSTIMIGNNTMTGNTQLTGSVGISGSLTVNGNINVASGSEFYLAGNKLFNYGQFCDLTIQSGSQNTAYPMKLNTTEVSHGISVVSGSQLKVENTGIYNIQFSAQIEQTTNNPCEFSIWLRKDGINIPNSNTELSIEKNGKMVAAWNYILELNANQYAQLIWSSTRSDTQLHYHNTQSTPTRPATPSVIVSITQVA